MKSPEHSPLIASEDFLRESMGSEAEASLAEFLEVWRSSENLRRQIRQIVESERITVDSSVLGDSLADPSGNKHTDSINSSDTECSLDLQIIASQVEEHLAQSYGGLSRKVLYDLLNKHKVGKRDLGAYLLIRAWKRHAEDGDRSSNFQLRRLTLAYIERAIIENRADFFREIAYILEFLKDGEFRDNGRWNHDPGQWWQFHLLLYIFEHPKKKYTMREFVSHFEQEVGTNEMPTTKTIRAFCRANGITLDPTPGAPKKGRGSQVDSYSAK